MNTATTTALSVLLASGESVTLEFKKSTAEKDRACRTLCAFANGQGWRVRTGWCWLKQAKVSSKEGIYE